MYCVNCGKEFFSSDKFCRFCGKPIKKVKKISKNLNNNDLESKNKDFFSSFSKIKPNIKQRIKNREKKKEEELKSVNQTINEINNELLYVLKEYKEYLKDKTRFHIHLEEVSDSKINYNPEVINKHSSTTKLGATLIGGALGYAATSGVKTVYRSNFENNLIRKGYDGNLTFYEDYIELLPKNEGETFIIPFEEIRKVRIEKPHILMPKDIGIDHYFLEGIFIRLYLHNGEEFRINIFNTVTIYQDFESYPDAIDSEGHLNYSDWFEIKHKIKFDELSNKYLFDKRFSNVLTFYKNILDIGCEMELTLSIELNLY